MAAAAPLVAARAFSRSAVRSAARFGPITRELFLASPRPGVSVWAQTFYTRRTGMDLISIHELTSRSDTADVDYFRYSSDNGRTWTPGEEMPTLGQRPQGKLRRAMRGAVVDPFTGRFLRFRNEGILPTDDPLEGMRQWVVYYSASEDGGQTWYLDEEIICRGSEFDAAHPLPGVRTGHNCVMVGDPACKQVFLADGTLLVPVIITPTGPDGNYVNPGGGYTYTEAAVLRGRWAADRRHLEWELSQRVQCDPNRSTRGADEPTVAVLADGRLLMLIRGSNDRKPALPGWRWVSHSSDQGRTWAPPVPWTYDNGESFFSPAACSQLMAHSSGRLFWLGNISAVNPTGNSPRYPMIIGEVDLRSGLLIKDSVTKVDDRGPTDSTRLQLTSPSAREDRETGDILVNLTRFGARSTEAAYDFTSNAYLYRIPLA